MSESRDFGHTSETGGSLPPPLQTTPVAEWYYVQNGTQKGPITADELKYLLRSKTIEPETQVWRTGLGDWKCVRETELVETIEGVPPPIAPALVRNGIVWAVAVLPLVVGVIDASIIHENQMNVARTFQLGFPLKKAIPEIPILIPPGITVLLCIWDGIRLGKAGYDVRKIVWTAIILAPIYLFLRAKKVKQRPTYAITWLVTAAFSLLLLASVSP